MSITHSITLRDVMFLAHPKPKDKEQAKTFKDLANNTLESPDTWEVSLSGEGKDKKAKWERLLKEDKLGGMALLRNLRNFREAGVSDGLVKKALANMSTERILPFRFIAAARYAPQWESFIEAAMMECLTEQPHLKGHTVVLVDVSGSMNDQLSEKSEMTRVDAACGVAICARELCKDVSIYSFSEKCIEVPARHGFALRDAIVNSQKMGGTLLGAAIKRVNAEVSDYDRLIVITDEQSHDAVSAPKGKGYIINVGAYENGVGYGKWMTISGWSDSVLRYIAEFENNSD